MCKFMKDPALINQNEFINEKMKDETFFCFLKKILRQKQSSIKLSWWDTHTKFECENLINF